MALDITLPEKCFIDHRFRLVLPEEEDKRTINIDGIDYLLEIISTKGANSYILGLIDYSDRADLEYSLVMKICKFPNYLKDQNLRVNRFEYEIEALKNCKDNAMFNIVDIIDWGIVNINFRKPENSQQYLFYIMEYAELDLAKLIENKKLDLIDKIELCLSITQAFNQLHKMGYYHRDIKHDNILFCDGHWKIGDLGLSANQNDEKSLDIENEKIGPYGWLSPEVMNKVLTEDKINLEYKYDCTIDYKSDIFQLGKLFWFIFQANLPIGNLKYDDDFEIKEREIFELVNNMLQYAKSRRPTLDEIGQKLSDIHNKHSKPV
jgi:serine/threonine protein kinase